MCRILLCQISSWFCRYFWNSAAMFSLYSIEKFCYKTTTKKTMKKCFYSYLIRIINQSHKIMILNHECFSCSGYLEQRIQNNRHTSYDLNNNKYAKVKLKKILCSKGKKISVQIALRCKQPCFNASIWKSFRCMIQSIFLIITTCFALFVLEISSLNNSCTIFDVNKKWMNVLYLFFRKQKKIFSFNFSCFFLFQSCLKLKWWKWLIKFWNHLLRNCFGLVVVFSSIDFFADRIGITVLLWKFCEENIERKMNALLFTFAHISYIPAKIESVSELIVSESLSFRSLVKYHKQSSWCNLRSALSRQVWQKTAWALMNLSVAM